MSEDKLRNYVRYLDEQIKEHEANSKLESISGSIAEEGNARALQLARDRFYSIFPEIRPADYKETK